MGRALGGGKHQRLETRRARELAPLAILEAALSASEAALLAAYAELYNGVLDGLPRGSSVLRARAVIAQAHWNGIAAYCEPENKVALGFVEGLNNKIRVSTSAPTSAPPAA